MKNKADGVVAVGVPVSVAVLLCGDTVDEQVACRIAVQTADDVQQRRLAAAGRTENGDKFIVAKAQAHAAECMYALCAAAVILCDCLEFQINYDTLPIEYIILLYRPPRKRQTARPKFTDCSESGRYYDKFTSACVGEAVWGLADDAPFWDGHLVHAPPARPAAAAARAGTARDLPRRGERGWHLALCRAAHGLAATIGTGNIVGVATALAAGGPGALLWMMVAALFGMATQYAEGYLAVRYRRRQGGKWLGGPFSSSSRGWAGAGSP